MNYQFNRQTWCYLRLVLYSFRDCSPTYGVSAFILFFYRVLPKGSKTPNAHIIFISSRPLNHLVCGSKGFFKTFFIKPRASIICQRPYKVINDHIIFIKSTRTIKPSNVDQTTSSDFFKSFFIKQGSSLVFSTTSTTPGDLRHPS